MKYNFCCVFNLPWGGEIMQTHSFFHTNAVLEPFLNFLFENKEHKLLSTIFLLNKRFKLEMDRKTFHLKIGKRGKYEYDENSSKDLIEVIQKKLRLRSIDLSDLEITDVKFLSHVEHLKTIHLLNCSELHDQSFDSLEKLQELEEFILVGNPNITSLSFIDSNPNLKRLNVSRCTGIKNFEILKHCTQLEKINLSYNILEANAFEYIENLLELKGIILKNCYMPDSSSLHFLKNLSKLEELDLSDNTANQTIKNFDALASLTNLRKLNLIGTRIRGLEFLKDLHQLEDLHLSGCLKPEVKEFYSLEHLTELREFSYNARKSNTSFEFISKNYNLETLDLSDSFSVSSYDFLNKLTKLQQLDLSGNFAATSENLAPIKNLSKLESLVLRRCTEITDLEFLKDLSQLKVLDISGCTKITDLEPLKNLSQLKWLNLHGCHSITDQSLEASFDNLPVGIVVKLPDGSGIRMEEVLSTPKASC